LLDTPDALLKGGDTGPAIVPGDPEQSLLISAVRYKEDKLQMPPKKPLAAEQISDLEAWVKMGAPWPPAEGGGVTRPTKKITDEDRAFWSFQPVKRPELPEVQDDRWAKNPIDRFIFKKLEDEALAPAADADKVTLIRRIYFDLSGPPMLTRRLLIVSSTARVTGSAGRGTGSTWSATPRATGFATTPTVLRRGVIATM
jgi:hypothetical protein